MIKRLCIFRTGFHTKRIKKSNLKKFSGVRNFGQNTVRSSARIILTKLSAENLRMIYLTINLPERYPAQQLSRACIKIIFVIRFSCKQRRLLKKYFKEFFMEFFECFFGKRFFCFGAFEAARRLFWRQHERGRDQNSFRLCYFRYFFAERKKNDRRKHCQIN